VDDIHKQDFPLNITLYWTGSYLKRKNCLWLLNNITYKDVIGNDANTILPAAINLNVLLYTL